jgi:hypothetical protein
MFFLISYALLNYATYVEAPGASPSFRPRSRFFDARPHTRGHLGEAGREEVDRPAGRVGITGPQLAVPEVLALPLETEQRVIGGAAALDRVVADPRLFLLPVEDEHGRVNIEDQPRRRMRVGCHLQEEPIVQLAQLRERRRCDAEQEPSQRGGIRIG